MKSILLLLLFLINASALALWAPLSELETNSVTQVHRKDQCPGECLEVPVGFNNAYHVVVNQMVDDLTKPINSKNEIESCLDQVDCEAKNAIKECADSLESVIMAADFSEIYCSKFLRYEQKESGIKIVQIDAAKKAAYDALKAQEAQLEAGLAQARKVMACSEDVMAYIGVLNAAKNPTEAEVEAVIERLAPIKQILEAGAYETSRSKILSVDITGTIMTETDRGLVVARLDSCVGV